MKYAFILVSMVAFPIKVLCRVLRVSRSGFYAWRAQPLSRRNARTESIRNKVRAAFQESRSTYGSPRVCAELRANGEVVSTKTVAKVMREESLVARAKKRFHATTDSKHNEEIAPNIVGRHFVTDEQNDTWVTDVTCVWTHQGWLFLAVMLDLFSRRVVGWATSATNDKHLALDALHRALTKRRPHGKLIHHSDRGSPYASGEYRSELLRFDITASMSRKGNCWDNAVAESFFSTLKTELVGDRIYDSHAAGTDAIGDYIDNFYNTRRRHSHIGYMSPIEFELISQVVGMAA